MELSKAFDMINHSLFLVRLKAYCFFDQVLCLQQSYLCNSFKRSKISGFFNSWNEVITRVPQGYVLGPLLL